MAFCLFGIRQLPESVLILLSVIELGTDFNLIEKIPKIFIQEKALENLQNHGHLALLHRERIDGLVQERRNSLASALELRLSCTKPLKWCQAPSQYKDTVLAAKGIFIMVIRWSHDHLIIIMGIAIPGNRLYFEIWLLWLVWEQELLLRKPCASLKCILSGYHPSNVSNSFEI